MILSENIEKVKSKALNLLNKGSIEISKLEKKLMLEMVLGMVLCGSSNFSEIGRHLREPIDLKCAQRGTKNYLLQVTDRRAEIIPRY